MNEHDLLWRDIKRTIDSTVLTSVPKACKNKELELVQDEKQRWRAYIGEKLKNLL